MTLFNEETKLFIDPKTAVNDGGNSAPPLCFVVSITGSAGPINLINLKCGLVLGGMHATGTP